MRLRHDCGRGPADVTHPVYNSDFTADGLLVTPRPNVDQQDYRPWADARHRYAAVGERTGDAANPYARTYTWRCKCRAAPISRRHERISEMWRVHADDPQALVVVMLADHG